MFICTLNKDKIMHININLWDMRIRVRVNMFIKCVLPYNSTIYSLSDRIYEIIYY